MRYAHWYWPVKGGRYPTRIASLDVSDGAGLPPLAGPSATEQPLRWALIVSELRGGEPTGTLRVRGESLRLLWQGLARLLCSKDRTWLYMATPGRVLPLIGFWDRLESKAIHLAGHDWQRGGPTECSDDEAADGVCVLSDPPTVILCGMADKPGKLLILDIRNYGIDQPTLSDDVGSRSTAIHTAVLSILSALRKSRNVSLRCTAASQAMQTLRQSPGCRRLHCHTNEGALRLARSAYYGGRCECYQLGPIPGPVYVLDVRSMYAAICRDNPVPTTLRYYHADERAIARASRESLRATIADVEISSASAAYPCRRGGYILYPTGRFRTALAGPELQYAVSARAITRWYATAEYSLYPALSGLYTGWLTMLATARTQGSSPLTQFIKRVSNSLVGKFAETGKRWVPVPWRAERASFCQYDVPDGNGELVTYRNLAEHTQQLSEDGESFWSKPEISAWINSYGRMQLWSYMSVCGIDNLYYVDTDALICGQQGYANLAEAGLVSDGTAGMLRLEGVYPGAYIHGYKHYEVGDKIVCAGPPRGEIRPGESRWNYYQRIAMDDSIRMGLRPEDEWHGMNVPDRTEYRHGRVLPSGRVVPIEVKPDARGKDTSFGERRNS